MGMGLAVTGGLLSGFGQGLSDDVAEMAKERAAELANQNQRDLQNNSQAFQGTQNDLNRTQQSNLQNSSQAFQGSQNQLNRDQQTALQNSSQTFQGTQTDKQIAATRGNLQITEGGANARQAAGFAHDDAPDTQPTVSAPIVLGNGNFGTPSVLNGVQTIIDSGVKAPVAEGKIDPAGGEALKAATDPIKGGADPAKFAAAMALLRPGTPSASAGLMTQQPGGAPMSPPTAAKPAVPQRAAGIPAPQSQADYAALPSGTTYTAPDGTVRTKP